MNTGAAAAIQTFLVPAVLSDLFASIVEGETRLSALKFGGFLTKTHTFTVNTPNATNLFAVKHLKTPNSDITPSFIDYNTHRCF